MKLSGHFAAAALTLFAAPALAQDDGGSEIIVTATRMMSPNGVVSVIPKRPVIGLRRQADSAVRHIEIVSDSRELDMRKREVEAMLLAAIDRAKKAGLSLVIGQYEVSEVTRENWRDKFPALAGKADDADDSDDDDDNDDDNGKVQPSFEDDGNTATARVMIKTKLEGSIADAQHKISTFAKAVPATGRSVIEQKGAMALTIIKPEQYRDEIFTRVAAGAKHAASFYGAEYGVNITGLDGDIAWAQVSNTEVFLYIPYNFTIEK